MFGIVLAVWTQCFCEEVLNYVFNLFNRHRTIQVICFLSEFVFSIGLVRFIKGAEPICIEFIILPFNSIDIYKIYSDVTSLIPDTDHLCLPSFPLIRLARGLLILVI